MNPEVIAEAEAIKVMYETRNDRGELPSVQDIARQLGKAPARISVLLELLNVPIRRGGKPQVIHDIDDLKARCDIQPGDSGCWLWRGSCDDYGYGTVSVAGRTRRVHQVALELTGVKLRPGQLTRRLCSHAHCCNPAHVAFRPQDVAVVDAARTEKLDRSRGKDPNRIRVRNQHPLAAPTSAAPTRVPVADDLPAPIQAPAVKPARAADRGHHEEPDDLFAFWAID